MKLLQQLGNDNRMLEYIVLIIAFVATMLGVVGKTTKDHVRWPRNITFLGWVALLLAASSLTASMVLKHQAGIARNRSQYWAMRELEFATYRLLSPYLTITDPPEKDERFHLSKGLIEADAFHGYCDMALSASCRDAGVTYGTLSTERTKEACSAMGDVLSRYSSVLSSDTVELITRLRTDPWTQIMLNAHDRELRGSLYVYGSSKRWRDLYVQRADSFALLVVKLEDHLGSELPRLGKELQYNDEAAFLPPLKRGK